VTDTLISRLGRAAAWLNLLLVVVVLSQVVLRYGFHHGLVPLEELMWHLYATAFMFGFSYALVRDAHVRVDLLHGRWSARTRAWVEIAGILCLLLPFAFVIFHHSLDWVAASYRLGESSQNPTGLPYRWLIKGVIPASFGLLLLAALSRLWHELPVALGRDR
jgi:TRAP-type mannitol/chloroaromatic compound transport system permease small subunit